MTGAHVLGLQSQRLLQAGLILILYSSLDGFAIPYLGSPRIGLSVHTLSAFQAVFLLAQGLLWPRLTLSSTASWVTFRCSLHETIAILADYTFAGVCGVGNETITLMGELPHGLARGNAFQDMFIKVLAYSSAPTGLTSFALMLWSFRVGGGSAA